MKVLYYLIIFTGISVATVVDVQACTCGRGGTPILAYNSTPVVFIGKVTSIEEDKVRINRFGHEQEIRRGLTAYLSVVDAFKGISQKEATIQSGGGSADCGYPLEAGETYFVFAYPAGDPASENYVSKTVLAGQSSGPGKVVGASLTTSICTMTGPLTFRTNELEIIREHLAGNVKPRIYGSIRERLYDFDGGVSSKYVGPVPDVTVVAEGPRGRYEVKSDQSGNYAIKRIEPGKYTLRFLIPPTLTNHWSWEKATSSIELKSDQDSLEIGLDVQVNAGVKGRLLNSAGRPVPDQVKLSLVPLEYAQSADRKKNSRSAYTEKGGTYFFEGVKPGKYILGVSIADAPAKHTPYSKAFFPIGTDPTKAEVVEVKIGEPVKIKDIRLPAELQRIVVEGVVVSASGRPVAGADVDIYDSETPDQQVFGFSDGVKTDVHGRFKITGFKGRTYLIRAYKDEDYFAGTGVQSRKQTVLFNGNSGVVRLALDQNGIFSHQLK